MVIVVIMSLAHGSHPRLRRLHSRRAVRLRPRPGRHRPQRRRELWLPEIRGGQFFPPPHAIGFHFLAERLPARLVVGGRARGSSTNAPHVDIWPILRAAL